MRRVAVAICVALLAGCSKANTAATAPALPGVAPSRDDAGRAAPTRRASTIPHTLRIGDDHDITSLNPHLASVISLGYMSSLTMAYLVRYGPDNRPIPELATAVPSQRNHLISADGLTITWHLRKGVKWSDGAPFDADDVVFSTNAVNNPQNNEATRDGWDKIRKIDEPDKFTVVYHLQKAYSGFLPTFFGTAGANPCILPKHILGRYANFNNADYNSKPVGIGPFRYVKWARGDYVEMEANPYYWRGVPKLKKIIYKFIPERNTLLTQIQTGEIDLWPIVGLGYYNRVKALTGVRTLAQPGFVYSHIDFNASRPPFDDVRVRKALLYGIDRQTILNKTQFGLGVVQDGPLTPTSPMYTALPRVSFDLTRANALLDAAGWKRGADGIRAKGTRRLAFDLSLGLGLSDIDQAIELMRSTWSQLGAQIGVRRYAPTLMFGPYQQGGIIYTTKFDAALFAWQVTPDADLSALFGCNQMPPNGGNELRYCNAKAEAYFDAAKATYDESKRKPFIAAAEKQIIADVPDIVLWVRDDVYAYSADLTGWKPNGTTPFDAMMRVDI